jgi:hypothetical protein
VAAPCVSIPEPQEDEERYMWNRSRWGECSPSAKPRSQTTTPKVERLPPASAYTSWRLSVGSGEPSARPALHRLPTGMCCPPPRRVDSSAPGAGGPGTAGPDPLSRLPKTVEAHWEGILRWFQSRISNGLLEGLSSLVQATKARARGVVSSCFWKRPGNAGRRGGLGMTN